MHDTLYRIRWTGGTVDVGDWVLWMRNNHQSGAGSSDACTGAAALAAYSASHNDFVYGTDAIDNPSQDDLGGLVRSADLDGDGTPELFSDMQLQGTTDGRTDTNLFNSNAANLIGTVHDSSTYTLCLADASANGEYYSQTQPPSTDAKFTHYSYVQIHVQHKPPSPPPPSPPPPSHRRHRRRP